MCRWEEWVRAKARGRHELNVMGSRGLGKPLHWSICYKALTGAIPALFGRPLLLAYSLSPR
jgi:hypothetical protein